MKSPGVRGFYSAPERTRTSTDHTVHKALNLARLPIPPQAPGAASIALPRAPKVSSSEASCRLAQCLGRAMVVSVLAARYIAEHTFESAAPNKEQAHGLD
jgi:hypothetical protein